MIERHGAWWRAALAGVAMAAASLCGCSATVVHAPSDAAVSDLVVVDLPPAVDAPVVDLPPAGDASVVDTPPAIDTPVVDTPLAVDVPVIDTPAAVDVPIFDTPLVVDVPVVDTRPAMDTPSVACDAGTIPCGATCVNTTTDVSHCGACNRACGTGWSCVMGACACPAGQHPVGTVCVADDAPRPVAPISLGDVTQRRPTLRWALPAGIDGAVVELCRDRACTMILETLRVTGTSARPTADLPPRSTVFWRMRGRAGAVERSGASPTWIFHVPAASASTAVDTSFNPHLDINGDGFDDVVVGTRGTVPGRPSRAGTASVYYGSATWTQPAAGTARTPDRLLEGAAGEGFGGLVASAGDVNGDGYADLVVGAGSAAPGGRPYAGTASVFYGSATWTQPAAGIASTPDRLLEGVAAGDEFGWSVASAGDVDSDGYADLVVGARGADPGGRNRAGTVSVFYGSATWTRPMAGIASTPDRLFEGAVESDNFGESVASAGDVNGDGYADLVVGAPEASPGGHNSAGTASVFLGSATWIQPPAGTASSPPRLLEGAAVGGYFGSSVASAGDVNGDGYADLVVGAFDASSGGRDSVGTASVYYGSATWTQPPVGTPRTPDRFLEGAATYDHFGGSVASAGDVNGDGYADLVVGAIDARSVAGTASLFHGSATWTQPPAGTPRTPDRLLEGAWGDWFGWSVASAGDVNGDGYVDLIVGAPEASPGLRLRAGKACVYYGSATWTQPPVGTPSTPDRLLEGAAENDYFGWSVAIVGDVNDDDFDGLVGASLFGPRRRSFACTILTSDLLLESWGIHPGRQFALATICPSNAASLFGRPCSTWAHWTYAKVESQQAPNVTCPIAQIAAAALPPPPHA